jgi:L-fucose isomerase-like protein
MSIIILDEQETDEEQHEEQNEEHYEEEREKYIIEEKTKLINKILKLLDEGIICP